MLSMANEFKIDWHKAIEDAAIDYADEYCELQCDSENDHQRAHREALLMLRETIKAALSKAPAWVPVKEKMPDMPPDAEGFPRSCVVLIYCLDGYIGSAHAAIYEEKVEWYSDDDYSHNYVTHWMPLPARPFTSIEESIHNHGCADVCSKSPTWKDAPDAPGLWVVGNNLLRINELDLPAYQNSRVRWYGPVPDGSQ